MLTLPSSRVTTAPRLVSMAPDYAEYVKFADLWMPVKQGHRLRRLHGDGACGTQRVPYQQAGSLFHRIRAEIHRSADAVDAAPRMVTIMSLAGSCVLLTSTRTWARPIILSGRRWSSTPRVTLLWCPTDPSVFAGEKRVSGIFWRNAALIRPRPRPSSPASTARTRLLRLPYPHFTPGRG